MKLFNVVVGLKLPMRNILVTIRKRACDYWIHNEIECCQTVDNVNCCPPRFRLLKYISNDDIIRPINNIVPCTVNTDDDELRNLIRK